MFDPDHDFHRAVHQARIATRRRDFTAAHQWMTLAERHVRLHRQMLAARKLERAMRPDVNPPHVDGAGARAGLRA